jgi:SAM-dependent methyltransferase
MIVKAKLQLPRSPSRGTEMPPETTTYDTWHLDADAEAAMAESHRPMWRHFVSSILERDLSRRDVLDFGCNRGGFLRLLYAMRPFRGAVGIDIAHESVRVARSLCGEMPIDYEVATSLARYQGAFDIAFSYEVIYLLPDLEDHARQMHAALKFGGVYYAVTGCHTHCPLWPHWRSLIARDSNAPVQDRSPEDYADAFARAGFKVSVKRFGYDGFVPADKSRAYYPRLMDAVTYPADDKLLFRLERG